MIYLDRYMYPHVLCLYMYIFIHICTCIDIYFRYKGILQIREHDGENWSDAYVCM